MKLKYSVEKTKARIFKIHGEEIILDETTYVDVKTKCRFVDRIYGEWWATPNNVANGQSHPKKGVEKRRIRKRLSLEEIKKRIFNIHGNIVMIDEFSYVAVTIKARFIDKDFGEWFAIPDNVMRGCSHPAREKEKIKQTCLKKYGVESPLSCPNIRKKANDTLFKNYGVKTPMHNESIALKSAENVNYSHTLFHWKTQEKLVCVGSYEKAVVEWLNKNQIDFLWQMIHFKYFTMKDGRKYRPDLFLIKENKWIEIKGVFRDWDPDDDAHEKWDWFHKEYSNSELWTKDILQQKEIL